MNKLTCLLAAVMLSVCVNAQRNTDFAARYMEMCDGDTLVQCVTVSPKMMEQLTVPDSTKSQSMQSAIQKLRSARIITASSNGEAYYEKAENILKSYPQRFEHYESYDYDDGECHGAFYIRKKRNGEVTELIMLRANIIKDTMTIINLTGDIDGEFISSLMGGTVIETGSGEE